MLVLTGLRIGELLALRWRNIDLEKKELRVTQSVYDGHFDVPKTPRSRRSVPLGPKAVEILTAAKAKRHESRSSGFRNSRGQCVRPAQPNEPPAQGYVQEAWACRSELALVAACERDATGRSWNTFGYGSSSSRALLFGDHPRGVLALDLGGCSDCGGKS